MFDHPFHPIPPKHEWPEGSELRSKFGQQVLWCPKSIGGSNLSSEELEPYRFLGDGKLDRILRLLDEQGTPLRAGDDFLLMAEKASKTKESLRSSAQKEICSFLETYEEIPEWVDKDQLQRGQEVFLAYAPSACLSLYYRSLVPGFAIPKIAAVVRSTAYLSPPSRPDQSLQRLLDTGELTAACTALGVDSLLPGGVGWKVALHVRVLHAKVRHALMRKQGKGRWDLNKFGVPINQEDMAATLLAFSVNTIVGIEFVAGVELTDREKTDYLALWRYIGWLLGVETIQEERTKEEPSIASLPPLDPCGPGMGVKPDAIVHSFSLLQSILFHILDPDESSIEISHHLLKVTDRKPPSMSFREIPEEFYKNELFYFRSLQCRRFIGNPLADALHLPYHPSPWKRAKLIVKSTIFLTAVRIYTLAAKWIPGMRLLMTRYHAWGFSKFHEHWLQTHKSKLAKALHRNEKPSCITKKQKSSETRLDAPTDSLCPFAMIASPN